VLTSPCPPLHASATRVFGADRHGLIRPGLAAQPAKQCHADTSGAKALRRQIADLTARQDRLITELEATDPGDRTFRERLRHRFDALETERPAKATQLATLEDSQDTEPVQEPKPRVPEQGSTAGALIRRDGAPWCCSG
jgi:site-specific DNA recombinase